MDVSIIIVNYNTKELTQNCLRSIYEQTKGILFEVIVSDNGSTDGSVEMIRSDFPLVTVIENNANLGFGAANNRGLAIAKGKYVFYLNSDTVLLNNAVKIFFDYWKVHQEENIGALGCNLVDGTGEMARSYNQFIALQYPERYLRETVILLLRVWGKSFLHSLSLYSFKITNIKHKMTYGEVDFIIGADLFVKNNDCAKYDENIFMYCEEVDLQWRMKQIGLKRLLIDGPKIVHFEGASNNTNKENREILDLSRFANIATKKNTIYLLKKYKIMNKLQLLVLKIMTLLLFLNPLIFKNSKKHITEMLRI